MASVPYGAWLEYLKLVHAYAGRKPASILDVCCGTGTMAEALALEGLDVAGVDASEPMIRVARRKGMATYHVGDVTSVRLGRTFEAAFSFFDSLNYVASLPGLRAALESVALHLEPGATFVFDLNTAYAFQQRMFDQRQGSKRAAVQYAWKGEYDEESRIIRVDMWFESGGKEFRELHVQRAHSDDEVRAGLADAGFVDVEAFDAFTLSPPKRRSDRVHYLARRG